MGRSMNRHMYNVGVFVVNLRKWKERSVTERIERLIVQQNQCEGRLWLGGSQPPLLLAFFNQTSKGETDYIVLDAAWNTLDLGWRTTLKESVLTSAPVLHWNGLRKPWLDDGLYKHFWQPHATRFVSM